MSPRWSRSNPLALAVLVCLYERPMHPYEVAQTLRSRAKQESVRLNYGSLYAVVESLEKKGFVKATGTVREGKRPPRTIYEITDDGARRDDRLAHRAAGRPDQGVPRTSWPDCRSSPPSTPTTPWSPCASGPRPCDSAGALRGVLQAAPMPACPACSSSRPSTRRASRRRARVRDGALVDEMASGRLDGLDLWRCVPHRRLRPRWCASPSTDRHGTARGRVLRTRPRALQPRARSKRDLVPRLHLQA